jgi:hypothetical protein
MKRLRWFLGWFLPPPCPLYPPAVDSDRAVRGIGWAGDRPIKRERKPS